MGVPDELQDAEDEGREGADDSMAWLNQLASNFDDETDAVEGEQDAASAGLGEADEGEIPEWLRAELNAGSPAEDSVPEWLRQELAAQEIGAGESSAEAPADDESALLADLVVNQGAPDADEEILAAVSAVEPTADEADEDLSWLETIAAGAGSVLEEPPTMSWEDEEAVADQAESSLDEEMSWLADLAEDEGDEPADAVPAEEEPILELAEEIELSLLENDLEGAFDVPEDPDEAMAWLERLAAQQGAAAEELTLFAHDEEAVPAADIEVKPEGETLAPTDTVDDLELPADSDQALAWLAELAGETLAFEESAGEPIDEGGESEFAGEAPLAHEGVEEWLEEVTPDEAEEPLWAEPLLGDAAAGSQPADEGDAERWLAEVADEAAEVGEDVWAFAPEQAQPIASEELSSVDAEMDTAPEAPDLVEAVAAAELGEPEELAEGEELLLDESVEETEAEALPAVDWEDEEEAPVEPISEVAGGEADQPEAPDQPAEEVEEGLLELDELVDAAELDEALPDWLPMEEGATETGETAEWLKSVDTWDAVDEPQVEPVAGEAWSLLTPEEMGEISQPVVEVTVDELEREDEMAATEEEALGELNPAEVAAARAAMEAGNFREASVAYDALLKRGEGLPFLIAELESAAAANTEQPHLHRLLGDAYVQNGQLQKALEVYRTALDQL